MEPRGVENSDLDVNPMVYHHSSYQPELNRFRYEPFVRGSNLPFRNGNLCARASPCPCTGCCSPDFALQSLVLVEH